MVTCAYRAVKLSVTSLILAALFSMPSFAADSSLYSLESGLSRLVYTASRSVVTIESKRSGVSASQSRSNGLETFVSTGLLVDSGLYVLASAKMVAGYSDFAISFENRRIQAELVGIDYFHEIALLRMSVPIGVSAHLCNEHSCAGQMVLALSDSYGVRAAPSLGFCAGSRPNGSMQFTMALTSETSGGGVFNLSGELVGMISGAIGNDNQVVVAIPSHVLMEIIDDLRKHGDRMAGYIGVTTQDIEITPPLDITLRSNSLVSAFTSPVSKGTMVVSVTPAGPAGLAGLRSGDIVYAVDGDPVGSSLELSTYVRLQNPKKKLRFDVVRRGVRLSIPVIVGSKPLSMEAPSRNVSQMSMESVQPDSLGLVVQFLIEKINRLEQQIIDLR